MALFTLQSGRFVAERDIATGGGGQVFEGRDTLTDDSVAIKRSHSDSKKIKRFQTECNLLCDLSHRTESNCQYVVQGIDFFEEHSQHYLVMEFVKGQSLDLYGKCPVRKALKYTESLLKGLSFLHGIGCTHRDIKPANLIHPSGSREKYFVKIVDLGLAKVDDGTTITQSGLGTYRYSAPECLTDYENITRQADIYSVGAVLYFLIAGLPPGFELCFQNTQRFNDDLRKWANGTWTSTPLSKISSGVTKSLSDFVARCLAADARKRPESVNDCMDEVKSILKPYDVLSNHGKVLPMLRQSIKKSIDAAKVNLDPVTTEGHTQIIANELRSHINLFRSHLSGSAKTILQPLQQLGRDPRQIQTKVEKLIVNLEHWCNLFSPNANGATEDKLRDFLKQADATIVDLLILEHQVDHLLVGVV